jgi:aspartyl protease family protein
MRPYHHWLVAIVCICVCGFAPQMATAQRDAAKSDAAKGDAAKTDTPSTNGAPAITLLGLFPGKALLSIDKSAPRAVNVGETLNGIKLLAVDDVSATVLVGGKKVSLQMGQPYSSDSSNSNNAPVVLGLEQGHFFANGKINGSFARMMVDTGASTIAIPVSEAQRMGIDYQKGRPVVVGTAGGNQRAYRVMLDSVTVGTITLYQVEAMITGDQLSQILLGMSFLNRTTMQRDGEKLVLTKRF